MALLSRSSPGIQDLEKSFEKAMEGIPTGQNLKRDLLPAALKIAETVETEGWKEIIEPFLNKNGDPAALLGRTKEEYEKLEPRVNAYYRFRRLIETLLEIARESSKGKID